MLSLSLSLYFFLYIYLYMLCYAMLSIYLSFYSSISISPDANPAEKKIMVQSRQDWQGLCKINKINPRRRGTQKKS